MFEKFIFHPRQNHPGFSRAWKDCELTLELNHQHLQGWLIKNEQVKNPAFIIYYGGNSEDISLSLNELEKFNASSFLLMNYRGYGNSSGRPTEQHLLDDALQIYDLMVKEYGISPSNIYLLGKSLGSYVASYVASQRTVRGLILVTPFDSFEHLVNKIVRWVPLGWLFKHHFNTQKCLAQVKCNILILSAEKDEVIPQECTQSLISLNIPNLSFTLIQDADHEDISEHDEFFSEINQFLSALEQVKTKKK